MCNSVRLLFFFFSDHLRENPAQARHRNIGRASTVAVTGISDQVIKVSKLSGITNDLLGGIL